MTDFESKLVAKTDENSLQKRSWTKIAEKRLQNAFQERQEAKKLAQGSGVAIKPDLAGNGKRKQKKEHCNRSKRQR